MKTKYIITSLIALGLFTGSVLIYNQISLKKPRLNITNSAPYHIDFYSTIKFSDGTIINKGPYIIGPGEKKKFNWEFDDEPEIYIYHKSSNRDEELLKWSLDVTFPEKGTRTIQSNNYFGLNRNLKDSQDTVRFTKMKTIREGFLYKKSIIEYETSDNEVLSIFRRIVDNNDMNILRGLLKINSLFFS